MRAEWSERLQQVEEAQRLLAPDGLAHAVVGDERLDGRHVEHRGRRVVNFGSCSYLGLELDERLKRAARDAIERYGVVFSSSRAYLSLPLFEEYEALWSELAGGHPVVLAPNTTLAHQAALPVLVGDDDAVCFDVSAHSSIQAVLPELMLRGVPCVPVPHNRIDVLERRARRLARKHERVFYLCDGVYSMRGDLVPLDELYDLLERLPALFAYVDDAHGLGWAGRNGAGVVLGARGLHERMAVTFGLAKSFATGGGVVVLPDAALARRVFTCGGPLIFTGPLQPAQLGAGIASAKIHLSPEIVELQARLRVRIERFDERARTLGIQSDLPSPSPIRFFEIGADARAAGIARDLLEAGFFVNTSVFPAVRRGHAGIRVMLTCRQTLEDIDALVDTFARCLERPPKQGAPPPANAPCWV
ncbi:MAG TPA: aminotransferase class I/II-fold pyridoxal phosphate-dependent enzyme [Polyangiaceae bacterium]